MKIRCIAMLTLAAFATVLMGCASIPEEHKGAATGAGIGAATGAVAGALLGSKGAKTEMAVLGGVIGALAGGAIGHYAYDTKRTQQETEKQYGYQPSQGTLIRLESVSVEPSTASVGKHVDFLATYAVMTPTAVSEISITEIREIWFGTELVGKPEVRVTRTGGTYTSKVPMTLPFDAKKGTYRVVTTIQSGTAKETKETYFVVS
jgi:hypothetical protein